MVQHLPKLSKGWVFAVAAIVLLGLCSPSHADYKIGVLAKRGAPKCMAKWGATGAYLTEKTGEKCTIVPLKFVAIEPAVKGGRVDFILANSAFYAVLNKKYNVRAVATLINSRGGKALEKFGGVLFVRKDSPIQSLQDIKGKKFMCVKRSSFGGAHMAWRLLLENGIDPTKDCAAFLEGGKHDNVVLAVKNGAADVGTVRSDTLERMQDEGKISMDEFRILHKVEDDFPFVHSTRLYPEWPLAALEKTDPALADKVAAALKAMPADSQAAKRAKIVGWTEPADYTPVEECLKAIHYGVFGE
ncbi:phosphate/phosphite/phosphonate ABC transporter binding protein [Desulfacinum hydrothermale DSM 13146]|uniref:Phosphate/phosphite/phosphonate ABC transporter binding protein n=1 Tax=Desulfacinum hydrothermale DSM 13146 TaxID=1121390 RepID=A0A1W1XCK6_9BACT|nr:phosphate/phosphite/phosphonate ABC transporter substrate-binding protein [Desulfacinum hydrothermale]SMC21607.1 phosphate/phosphite/phosphonate ABC transporter binding protein [Desulfacinum hydrothermale DSM 13146]